MVRWGTALHLMQYRDFKFTNELGQVELARGSIIGEAVARLTVKLLLVALMAVGAGTAIAGAMYFSRDAAVARQPEAPQGAMMNYAGQMPEPGVYHSHGLVPHLHHALHPLAQHRS